MIRPGLTNGTSIAGTGLRTLGCEPLQPDGVRATVWLTVLFIPIFPLYRAEFQYLGEPSSGDDPILAEVSRHHISWRSVFRTYVLGTLATAVATAPLVLAIFGRFPRFEGWLDTAYGFFVFCWPVAVIELVERQRRRLLESSWNPTYAAVKYPERLRAYVRHRTEHFLPMWMFLLVVGCSWFPGVVIADWRGWSGWTKHASALISVLVISLLTGILDILLSRRTRPEISSWRKMRKP